MTASGFPTLAGVLIPSVRGGSQVLLVGKRNFVRVSNRAEGPRKRMNLVLGSVKTGRASDGSFEHPRFAPAVWRRSRLGGRWRSQGSGRGPRAHVRSDEDAARR
jgi:hypothetical protein